MNNTATEINHLNETIVNKENILGSPEQNNLPRASESGLRDGRSSSMKKILKEASISRNREKLNTSGNLGLRESGIHYNANNISVNINNTSKDTSVRKKKHEETMNSILNNLNDKKLKGKVEKI